MKASRENQQKLLEVAALDLSLMRLKLEIQKIHNSKELEKLRAESLKISDLLVDSRNKIADTELKLKRSESDLELAEKRLGLDMERLASARNQKDAEGLQHEIDTLKKRISDLEDLELGILEELDSAKSTHEKLNLDKRNLETEITTTESGIAAELANLNEQISNLTHQREVVAGQIDSEILANYTKKLDRGVAIAPLVGRECGACHLSITATYFDELSQLPLEEMAECPSCQAWLVRS